MYIYIQSYVYLYIVVIRCSVHFEPPSPNGVAAARGVTGFRSSSKYTAPAKCLHTTT